MAESQFPVEEQTRDAQKHPKPDQLEHVATAFEAAIRLLAPSTRKAVALFDNRATRGAIHHWCKGRRAPPQWARDRIAALIARHATIAANVQAMPYAEPGETALARYRAQKAKGTS